MRRGLLIGLVFIMVIAITGLSFAGNTHQVQVTIQPYVIVNVTGTPSATISTFDPVTGAASAVLNGYATMTVKTNSNSGCTVNVTASDFSDATNPTANTFAIAGGKLQMAASSVPMVPLTFANNLDNQTPVKIFDQTGKQNNTVQYEFFKVNLDGSETASNKPYSSTITYTAAVK